ncbi:hypothetical protein IQ07DRAFT_637272 [Pyrenochaeta sp. DS3sAY3a]|nr:hypothetical protein IQ07DRAFT_637272 [Pyrenochaeta sp. DS3sAY3a]
MPRKKQGLRSYHHKSRNGCAQCKRRRVKCSMQAPTCANCLRRNELCEYPGVLDESVSSVSRPLEPRDGLTNSQRGDRDFHSDLDMHLRELQASIASTQGALSSEGEAKNKIDGSTDIHMSLLIRSVLNRAWFGPVEAALWSNALAKKADKYPYLQHCIFSLACLRRDMFDEPVKGASVAAYQHQLIASRLFRQDAPEVTSENWIAVVAFHVSMLVFQFATQSDCTDADFNLVNTMRVLRSSDVLEAEAKPFFQESKLWELIVSRETPETYEFDSTLRTNLQALAGVIAESVDATSNDADDDERAEINRQACCELRNWVLSCNAHPKRWDVYCHWPGRVTPEFFDLLDDKDDLALLLVIHWCAVLYRSPKPSVTKWANRAARFAMDSLQDRSKWENLLVWPLQSLSEPRREYAGVAEAQQSLHEFDPEHSASLFDIPDSQYTSSAILESQLQSSMSGFPITTTSTRNATSPSPAPFSQAASEYQQNADRFRTTAAPSLSFHQRSSSQFDESFTSFTSGVVDPTLLAFNRQSIQASDDPFSQITDSLAKSTTSDDFGMQMYLYPQESGPMDLDLIPVSRSSS